MEKINNYRDLEIWKLSVELVIKVYKLLETFPKDERYGLIAQTKDAACSVPANIAEGFGRFHYKDRIKFLYNSRGSLFEIDSHLIIGNRLGFITKINLDLYQEIIQDISKLGVKINNSIDSLYKQINCR